MAADSKVGWIKHPGVHQRRPGVPGLHPRVGLGKEPNAIRIKVGRMKRGHKY